MIKYLFLWLFIILIMKSGYSQQNRYYYENAVFRENIKTVMMYRAGFELSNPVLFMNEDMHLVFKFDDLGEEEKDYSYTIIHCDAKWNESYLSQADYLNGIAENPLLNYKLSFNTSFHYKHYELTIPNENVRLNYSGNYVLVVYEGNDKNKVVVTQRFYLVDPRVTIQGRVRRATFDPFEGTNHEVDFAVVYNNNFTIENPLKDVKVVLMQNNRWDNAITDLKPLYIRASRLEYDYNKENVFQAGNEFRYFDNRTNRYNGENVIATDFHNPYYHKTIKPDEIRANKDFFLYQEMNGKFTIESQDQEVRDADTECDYTFVHFTLPMQSPLLGGTVNVFGALSGWNANKSNEMTWNFNTSAYELSMLLKQGYYNYQYVYVPQGAKTADATNIEGSFWETGNEYQIFVYYSDYSARYDRLVGYILMDSNEN